MSWLDKVNNPMIIETGNGQIFRPQWMNATKSKEFNVSEFEFPSVKGTKAYRGEPKGRRYNIEIYFTGENHLDEADRFDRSADDPRDWTLTHPLYGSLNVVPLSLVFDNKADNVTKITGAIIESIPNTPTKVTVDPVDRTLAKKIKLFDITAKSFVVNVPAPKTATIAKLKNNVSLLYRLQAGAVKTALQAQAYFNLFNDANAALTNATALPLAAIQAVQAVINYPSQFEDTVKNRIDNLSNQFSVLRESVETLLGKADKTVYENNAEIILSSMCESSVTNYEYANRAEVVDVINKILAVNEQFLGDLDDLQDDNGGEVDSYMPDADSMMALSDLVSFTVSNLFSIAKNAKQERSFYLENDSNVVLLTHRLFGLQPDDSTVEQFISVNKIGLNELLQIRKDRLITYYV